MMEWLILLVVVPAILVPIVLLWGFAGCFQPPTIGPVTMVALEVDPVQTPPVVQAVAPANYCFVQRIPAASLFVDGEIIGVRFTLVGAPTGNVTINSFFVSRAAPTGNLWDSGGDLTSVLPSPLTVPDDQPKTLDVLYGVQDNEDLIFAFDFTATAGQANIVFAPVPGVTLHFKPGVQQAGMPIRDPDFNTQPDPRLYLVVKIVLIGYIE